MTHIPVFVSRPSLLNPEQARTYSVIERLLRKFQLEPRRLGASDYPTELPLREVATMARHCSGGLILGFEQIDVEKGVAKRGTANEKNVAGLKIPTPWNNLEAGILFGLGLPLLVFREEGITGGVFDSGVTDAFIHTLPSFPLGRAKQQELEALLIKWQSKVREVYYRS